MVACPPAILARRFIPDAIVAVTKVTAADVALTVTTQPLIVTPVFPLKKAVLKSAVL